MSEDFSQLTDSWNHYFDNGMQTNFDQEIDAMPWMKQT